MGFETTAPGFYPDRIRVISGENGRKSAHGKHGRHGRRNRIFYHGEGVDGEWMGLETTGLGVLSRSYPCDPWLTGSESTKAFFTTDGEWMGNGWDLR